MEDAVALAWAFRSTATTWWPRSRPTRPSAGRSSRARSVPRRRRWSGLRAIGRYVDQEPRAVRVQPADPEPAGDVRQPAAARSAVRARRRSCSRTRSACRPGHRCSCPCGCAGWSCRTGSSSRRWTCTRPSTGTPSDFHLVHLGVRALWAAPALVMTEMMCVSAPGRITPGCAGIYCDEHVAAWKRIVDLRPRSRRMRDRRAARPLRTQGLDEADVGGDRRAAAGRRLGGDRRPRRFPTAPRNQVPR